MTWHAMVVTDLEGRTSVGLAVHVLQRTHERACHQHTREGGRWGGGGGKGSGPPSQSVIEPLSFRWSMPGVAGCGRWVAWGGFLTHPVCASGLGRTTALHLFQALGGRAMVGGAVPTLCEPGRGVGGGEDEVGVGREHRHLPPTPPHTGRNDRRTSGLYIKRGVEGGRGVACAAWMHQETTGPLSDGQAPLSLPVLPQCPRLFSLPTCLPCALWGWSASTPPCRMSQST